jgi:hypothetical protein
MNSDLSAQVIWLPLLVLVFTGVAWWVAKRDLTARAADERARTQAEWESVRSAAEQLIKDLERRAQAVEEKMTALEALLAQSTQSTAENAVTAAPVSDEGGLDTRYQEVAKLASGGLEPVEIARKTGLSRGEVDLVLSLRRRKFL